MKALILACMPVGLASDTSYVYTTIDFPEAIRTEAGGINNAGQIVGFLR